MKKSRRTPEELRQLVAEKIPEGMVVPEHTATAHYYRHTPSGLLLPSVTTKTGILGGGEHLKTWAAQCAVEHIESTIDVFMRMNMVDRQVIYRAAVLAHQDNLHDAGGVGTEGHGVAERYIQEWLKTGNRPDDITTFITGEDYRLWAIARSAQKFIKDYQVIPIVSEQKVARVWTKQKTGYAGTMDFLAYVAFPIQKPRDPKCEHDPHQGASNWSKVVCFKCGGAWQYKLTIVDWKTSNSIWEFPTPEGLEKQVKYDYVMQTCAYEQAFRWMTGIKVEEIVIVRLDKEKEQYEVGRVIDRAGAFKAFLGLSKAHDWMENKKQKSITLALKERISIDNL